PLRSAPASSFIDELDAIGKKRSGSAGSDTGGQGEMDQTLNHCLVEMDGMDTTVGVVWLRCHQSARGAVRALLLLGQYTAGGSAAGQLQSAFEAADFEARCDAGGRPEAGPAGPMTKEEREAGKALVALDVETSPPVGSSQHCPKARVVPEPPCWRPSPACWPAGPAETVAFQHVSSGGSDEQRAATDLAYSWRARSWACRPHRPPQLRPGVRLRELASSPLLAPDEALFDSEASSAAASFPVWPGRFWPATPGPSGPGGPRPAREEELGHEQLLELLGTSPHPKPELARELLDLAKIEAGSVPVTQKGFIMLKSPLSPKIREFSESPLTSAVGRCTNECTFNFPISSAFCTFYCLPLD
uniref:Protein Shroom1 n=1 Tax=Macrostomum lignano TaxID=282301 RepID=A0A1I8FC26_9PLAT